MRIEQTRGAHAPGLTIVWRVLPGCSIAPATLSLPYPGLANHPFAVQYRRCEGRFGVRCKAKPLKPAIGQENAA